MLIVFGIVTLCHAVPVPKMSTDEAELIHRPNYDTFDGANKNSNNDDRQTVRNGRQNGFYDYFSYPSEYSQPSYYPDYYSSYYDSFAYKPTIRPTVNRAPIGYPSRKKFDQRRKNFEASTQRWTVWDLARK